MDNLTSIATAETIISEMKSVLKDKEHVKFFKILCNDYIKKIKKKNKNSVKFTDMPVVITFD